MAEFIEKQVVPVRLAHDHQPLAAEMGIKWTPSILILDAGGKEHHRTVGFLGPDDLKASVLLGVAKEHFDADRFPEALAALETLIDAYPDSSLRPEAIFLQGVSRYKSTHSPQPLKAAYEQLSQRYPDSEWTRRAYPYRLL
ncbi:MAG: tetratricopeptide repeat protein [Thermodesulfobacteriota bacterium]